MSAPTWREQPPSTPRDHAAVQARFRALVRDLEDHPPVRKAGA
jgi:hypothetical protein